MSSSGALVALVSWAEPELAPPPNKMTINKMSPSGPATATSTTVLLRVTGGSLPLRPSCKAALLATALGVRPSWPATSRGPALAHDGLLAAPLGRERVADLLCAEPRCQRRLGQLGPHHGLVEPARVANLEQVGGRLEQDNVPLPLAGVADAAHLRVKSGGRPLSGVSAGAGRERLTAACHRLARPRLNDPAGGGGQRVVAGHPLVTAEPGGTVLRAWVDRADRGGHDDVATVGPHIDARRGAYAGERAGGVGHVAVAWSTVEQMPAPATGPGRYGRGQAVAAGLQGLAGEVSPMAGVDVDDNEARRLPGRDTNDLRAAASATNG